MNTSIHAQTQRERERERDWRKTVWRAFCTLSIAELCHLKSASSHAQGRQLPSWRTAPGTYDDGQRDLWCRLSVLRKAGAAYPKNLGQNKLQNIRQNIRQYFDLRQIFRQLFENSQILWQIFRQLFEKRQKCTTNLSTIVWKEAKFYDKSFDNCFKRGKNLRQIFRQLFEKSQKFTTNLSTIVWKEATNYDKSFSNFLKEATNYDKCFTSWSCRV